MFLICRFAPFPQNEDSSTHEKLDFKLHFTCTSYLITTPCYRLVMPLLHSYQSFSESFKLFKEAVETPLKVFPGRNLWSGGVCRLSGETVV